MPVRARTHAARTLRRNSRDAELKLWRALRELRAVKFRRQHPIGPYVTDFACPSRKLVIELDGGQHADQVDRDESRTSEIERRGYRVIRFWNHDVLANIDGVNETILKEFEPQ
jgi:very-short-patch-repair endonuclease